MLKKAFIFLLLAITLLVLGCRQNSPPFLEYQNQNFSAKATLKINGSDYGITVTKEPSDNYTLTFTAPDTVKGVCITKNNEGKFFSVGNVHIPLKDDSNITAETFDLFSLSKKELTDSFEKQIGGVKVNTYSFNCSFGKAEVICSAETRLPLQFTADVKGNEIILTFSEFVIT